eukprot:3853515-Prorocentrum_lima.AAC.1
MTSSLVGSEMCIRDRNKREKGESGTEVVCTQYKLMEEPESHDQEMEHIAVSYTHLTLPTICSV